MIMIVEKLPSKYDTNQVSSQWWFQKMGCFVNTRKSDEKKLSEGPNINFISHHNLKQVLLGAYQSEGCSA